MADMALKLPYSYIDPVNPIIPKFLRAYFQIDPCSDASINAQGHRTVSGYALQRSLFSLFLTQIISHRPLVFPGNAGPAMVWRTKEQPDARCSFAVLRLIGVIREAKGRLYRAETGSARRRMRCAYRDNIITCRVLSISQMTR
jgi:hypothetical protein